MIKKANKSIVVTLAVAGVWACNPPQDQEQSAATDTSAVLTVSPADFQAEVGGYSVKLFTFTNGAVVAAITNYGSRVVSLHVPSQHGGLFSVVLGYAGLSGFQQPGG